MGDTVLRVSKTNILDNPAAMAEKISALVEALYSGPEWQRQGPNFIANKSTGEVVNLNQAAIALLQEEGPREDAIAVIATPEGEEKRVFVNQDAVKAAGGDMRVLAANLQTVLSENPLKSIPPWAWIAAAAGVGYLVLRPRRASRFGR